MIPITLIRLIFSRIGVIGIILVYMLLRAVFRVDYDKEAEAAQHRAAEKMARACLLYTSRT